MSLAFIITPKLADQRAKLIFRPVALGVRRAVKVYSLEVEIMGKDWFRVLLA